MEIQIIPTTKPLTATVGDDLQFYCEAAGRGSTESSYLKWYKQTSPPKKVELDKSLVQRQGYLSGGTRVDKEVVLIRNVKKENSGTYICERYHTSSGTYDSRSTQVLITGKDFSPLF